MSGSMGLTKGVRKQIEHRCLNDPSRFFGRWLSVGAEGCTLNPKPYQTSLRRMWGLLGFVARGLQASSLDPLTYCLKRNTLSLLYAA